MDVHFLGAALSPLIVFFFACEMTSMTELYNVSLIPEASFNRRTVYFVFKLPASVLLPVFLEWTGVAIVAVLDIVSVLIIIRQERQLSRYHRD